MAALLAVSGCAEFLQTSQERLDELDVVSWEMRPLSEAWVTMPDAALLLERRTPAIAEQRILLPNETNLRGENILHIRTASGLGDNYVFDLERSLDFIGGVPFPFTPDETSGLMSRDDAAGTLIWAHWTNGVGLTCVLALRRVDIVARIVPKGAVALDLVMRNCVEGNTEQALAPLDPRAVAFPEAAAQPTGAPIRTISPLAAPGI